MPAKSTKPKAPTKPRTRTRIKSKPQTPPPAPSEPRLAKVTIVIEDETNGDYTVRFEFNPPLDQDAACTKAQQFGYELMHGIRKIYEQAHGIGRDHDLDVDESEL